MKTQGDDTPDGATLQHSLQNCADLPAEQVDGDVQDRAPNPETPAIVRDPVTKRYVVGNPGNYKHGGYARSTVTSPDARASIETKKTQITEDLGGPAELSQVRADAIYRYAEIDTVVRHLAGHLAAHGLFTGKGRMRAAYQAYLQAFDRWLRAANLIGLDRRERRLDILDQIADARAEAEAEHQKASQDGQDGPESTQAEADGVEARGASDA